MGWATKWNGVPQYAMVYCDVSIQHHQLGPKNKRQTNVWKMGKKVSEKTETSTERDKAQPFCRFYVCFPPLSIIVYTVDPCFGCECCNTTKELLSKAARPRGFGYTVNDVQNWPLWETLAQIALVHRLLVHGPMARFHQIPGTSNPWSTYSSQWWILHQAECHLYLV